MVTITIDLVLSSASTQLINFVYSSPALYNQAKHFQHSKKRQAKGDREVTETVFVSAATLTILNKQILVTETVFVSAATLTIPNKQILVKKQK